MTIFLPLIFHHRDIENEAPNSKIQIPNNIQFRKEKFPKNLYLLVIGIFFFENYLDFGIWRLEFRFSVSLW